MEQTVEKIIDSLLLRNGFEFDMDEGWHKLITSQFGGSPGRAFAELIQNAIDSYSADIPWKDRKGAIITTANSISITDWGEGLNTKRLSLLVTAGGTDKMNSPDKIGRFGLGFISIFNPHLGTRRVEVVTKCDGYTVELLFIVSDPMKRPQITVRILDKIIAYSTCITVIFSNSNSVQECIRYATKSLSYYPCSMSIDGELFQSEWHSGIDDGKLEFSENNCEGVLRKGTKWLNASILCKYELVMQTTLSHFITGGHNMKHNLEDYEMHGTPYIPDVGILFNINNLQLVISRDSYYLDWNYTTARNLLNRKLKYFLYQELKNDPDLPVIIANQYIFRTELGEFLTNPENKLYEQEENKIIRLLAEAPVYRINGRSGLFSLVKLKNMQGEGLPFYFSPERSNLRWLGGSFKHNFVVIPETNNINPGAPLLYDKIFEDIYKDTVNLDTIVHNPSKIQQLVNRCLVDKSALSPKCKILGSGKLTAKQKSLVDGLSVVLNDENIQETIARNLQIPVASIVPVFFSVGDEGIYLSTGIFDPDGKPISDDIVSNFLEKSSDNVLTVPKKKKCDLLLGLNLNHPFINYMVESTSEHKEYYALTYLAHELALCQKMLVPYSPYYNLVKVKLAQDIRIALIKTFLKNAKN